MSMNIDENGALIVRFGPQPASDSDTGAEDDADPDKAGTSQRPEQGQGSPESISARQAEFFRTMHSMQKKEELCDASLFVDGKEIKIHKIVLAACSSFFHAMFMSRMTEAQTSQVELKDVSYDTIKSIVDFAYTADIQLNDDNVQELLSAANQYQIQPIKDVCSAYLKSQLNAANCLGIKNFAEFHNCPDLFDAALKFVDENFEEVCKGEEFLQLELPSLLELLQRDELTVKCEDEVYDAAVRWMKHEDNATRLLAKKEVLSRIRFPLITRKYLILHIFHEPLVQDSCECLKMVMSGMKYHLQGSSEEDHDAKAAEPVVPRVQKHDYQIAVFGGSEPSSCQYFDPKNMAWTDFNCMSEKRRDHSVARVGNCVYVFGGSFLFTVSRIECYNVATQKWNTMTSRLENCRNQMAVCTYKQMIYISGGTQSHGSAATRCFDVYNPHLDRLTELRQMCMARYDHGIVECRGFIYALGGASCQNRILKQCERFNVTTTKWSEITPMSTARKGLGVVVFEEKIYVMGGQDENGALDTVECFDPINCKWSPRASMPYKLRTVKCAVVGDSVWVLTGYRDMGRLSTVLQYQPTDNKWTFHYNVKAFPAVNVALTTIDTCVVE